MRIKHKDYLELSVSRDELIVFSVVARNDSDTPYHIKLHLKSGDKFELYYHVGTNYYETKNKAYADVKATIDNYNKGRHYDVQSISKDPTT